MALTPDDDPVLQAQLAHLDAIEQRHEDRYARLLAEAARTEAESGDPPLPEEAWPAAIGEPPAPDGGSLVPYVAWVERARSVLNARAARNRDELQRLGSQWVHVSRHLTRFQPEEVASVVEAQSRVRERIAADETCAHLLVLVRAYLRAFEEVAGGAAELVGVPESRATGRSTPTPAPDAAAPPADVELVRRLLEDGAADRARDARRLLEAVLEALAAISLDMEVVQREAERAPDEAAYALRGLQDRLIGAVEDLRAQPGVDHVAPRAGEPLHATLRRCLERYQPRVVGDVAWSGGEPMGPEVRAAMLWVAQEFVAAAAVAGATSATVSLAVSPEASVLRLARGGLAAEALGAAEPSWVLRCGARAAVAGGTLAIAAADWSEVEVRFPGAPGEA